VEIFEKKEAIKVIKKLPKNIKNKYDAWKKFVQYRGVDVLKEIKGFKDHSLTGNWKGFRSSYLSNSWRVIYKVASNDEVYVFVERITNHNYKTK